MSSASERYRRGRRGLWIPVAVVLAVIGVGWIVWAGWYGANGVVNARVDAFTVVSDTAIDVTVSVQRPDASQGAECLVYAESVGHDRVAELPITVGSGGEVLTTSTVSLRTIVRATSAGVEDCRSLG